MNMIMAIVAIVGVVNVLFSHLCYLLPQKFLIVYYNISFYNNFGFIFPLMYTFEQLLHTKKIDHPTREAIVMVLKHNPGLTISEIAKKIIVPWSTIKYHIGALLVLSKVYQTQSKYYFVLDDNNNDGTNGLPRIQYKILKDICQNGYYSTLKLANNINEPYSKVQLTLTN